VVIADLSGMHQSMWRQILYKTWPMIMDLKQMFLTSQFTVYALRALSKL
jgi:hypothetical protein